MLTTHVWICRLNIESIGGANSIYLFRLLAEEKVPTYIKNDNPGDEKIDYNDSNLIFLRNSVTDYDYIHPSSKI